MRRHVLIATVALGMQAQDAAWIGVTYFGAAREEVYHSLAQDGRTRWAEIAARARQFQSRIPRTAERVLHETFVWHEGALFAVGRGRDAAAHAAEYVTALHPCYEWEAMPECPEREARFAEISLEEGGFAFNAYLPLIAAHRWICVAEFAYSDRQRADARARASSMLARASRAEDPVVRAVAAALGRRGTCYPG